MGSQAGKEKSFNEEADDTTSRWSLREALWMDDSESQNVRAQANLCNQ